ncbi:hypothetical protein Tco_0677869 [Tanacetum coccineum]|uniref:Retrovirus-related Pol polyprotein from transposon TNT 1-94 n=1 Tax=Tanacetum coccineum TaxID=301880 RepID=A0ABQ4XE61_9ASTR
MIVVGAENHPPMLKKSMYDSWKSRMLLYIQELSEKEKLHADCDLKATNIFLQGLPPDVYSLVNHHNVAKEIWDRVKLLMKGMELLQQERECKLYNEFDRFASIKGDDPISYLNKEMAFMSTVMASRFPSTNNQLKTSFNPRNQATIQDGRVTIQQGEGYMARQCTYPKRPRNSAWFKEKMLLVQAQEFSQTDDLDAYDSDCDDISSAKAILMANLFSYDLDVLSKSQFKFLPDTLQDFGTMPIFKRTFAQDMDLLEQHLTKDIISQINCKTILTKLRTTFENAFNSEFKEHMQEYTRFDVQSLYDAMIFLSKDDLKGTRIEHGFKRAFMSLFGQDVDTFTSTMILNVDQLQKQLDKDEFQEDGSMAAFWVINKQFQQFIDSKYTLDYDSKMTNKYFVEYTGIEVKHFRDTLLQHMGNVKKYVAERTRHQRQYDRRVNKRQLQMQESKIDTGKALDNGLGVMESNGIESEVQDDSSRSGNDTDINDADIRHIYDKEPMAKVGLTRQHGQILNETSNKAKIKKEIDVLETMNIELEHSVAKLRKENETLKKHYKDLYDSIKITRSKTIEQTTSLLANNADLKAQIQEKVFAIASLKNDLRKLKGNNVDTKFAKTSVLGKPVLQSL